MRARASLLVVLLAGACGSERPISVGSKKFTESVILGELTTRLLRDAGTHARHRAQLGGTRLLWRALTDGRIDIYPEYSGTLCQEILRSACDLDSIGRALAAQGVRMTRPLGFRDEYALAVRRDVADCLRLRRISDLANHPALRLGFSDEFIERADGWPALRARYRLPQRQVRALDHDLAHRGLASGDLDVIDVYTTDPELASGALVLLDDDLHLFTHYDALLIYRDRLPPSVVETLRRLEGAISQTEMRALNARARQAQVPESTVAADFLHARFGLARAPHADGLFARLRHRTVEHLILVGVSLLGAILLGVPLGIVAARWRRLGKVLVGFAGLAQTIPSLALLVFMIPLFGIGVAPALVALLVYALLPIVRNTLSGLDGIPRSLRESAAVLGLGNLERLRLIELPLASPSILAGIHTAAVIDVGMATLGALIGAGGYGQPILTGIRLDDTRLILEGAVPAAALALLVQATFEGLERVLIPRGLRGSLDRPEE